MVDDEEYKEAQIRRAKIEEKQFEMKRWAAEATTPDVHIPHSKNEGLFARGSREAKEREIRESIIARKMQGEKVRPEDYDENIRGYVSNQPRMKGGGKARGNIAYDPSSGQMRIFKKKWVYKNIKGKRVPVQKVVWGKKISAKQRNKLLRAGQWVESRRKDAVPYAKSAYMGLKGAKRSIKKYKPPRVPMKKQSFRRKGRYKPKSNKKYFKKKKYSKRYKGKKRYTNAHMKPDVRKMRATKKRRKYDGWDFYDRL